MWQRGKNWLQRHKDLPLWPVQPKPRLVLAWTLAAGLVLVQLGNGWWSEGWISCDFGSQWLQGRMLLMQQGHSMYQVGPQYDALATGYRDKALETLDSDILRKSIHGKYYGIEGPLYPPVAGLLLSPFAVLPPSAAHAVLVLIYAQLTLLVGWLLRSITSGRIRIGEGTLLAAAFPGFPQAVVLGQNSALTLAIVVGGWALWARRRPFAAGVVWGFLVYKPVFAVALIWVPLFLSGRMLAGMALSGAALCLATLPFCGLEAWANWWIVGHNNAELYTRDRNWIWMSRDLVGLPRRAMWDGEHFLAHWRYLAGLQDWDEKLLQAVQTGTIQTVLGWCLVGGVLGLTVLPCGWIAFRRWRRDSRAWPRPVGPEMAFLLLGALLNCYHFMHYDLLLFWLPTMLFLADAGRWSWWSRSLLIAWGLFLLACSIDMGTGQPFGVLRIPLEIFLFLMLWAWTGCLALREEFKRGPGTTEKRATSATIPMPLSGWASSGEAPSPGVELSSPALNSQSTEAGLQ